jgi:hypothetical protein
MQSSLLHRLSLSVLIVSSAVNAAHGEGQSIALPKSLATRFVDSSNATFRLEQGKAQGDAAQLAISVLNYFGTSKQISAGLANQSETVKNMLVSSKLPGVLIFVEHETSKTDTPVTLLVGDKPLVIGPGLSVQDTWEANAINDNRALSPQVRSGFYANGDASYFLWARLNKDGQLEYGLTVPAEPVLAEGRRVVSDTELHKETMQRYDRELRGELLTQIERTAETKDLREKASQLLEARKKALEERQKIDADLKSALERAAKAQKVAAVFDTLATILTFAKLGAELAAEFPDKADAIGKATSNSDLKGILDGIMTDAQSNNGVASGKVIEWESRNLNIRIQELNVIRVNKIDTSGIPGVLP